MGIPSLRLLQPENYYDVYLKARTREVNNNGTLLIMRATTANHNNISLPFYEIKSSQ